MTRKKAISQPQIVDLYMDYVLMHNKQPNSVYAFSKENNFEEQKFYEFFSSFEALEQSIFKIFFDNTHTLLEKSEDYLNYDSKTKLLSFYYTFFEILTANRSFVQYVLGKNRTDLRSLKKLARLKCRFTNYIEYLDIKILNFNHKDLDKLQSKSLKESAWIHLLMTLKFWLDDTSPSFEKTDIFIEKSVHASLDLIDITPLKNVIDFGKFLFKEKMQMN